MALNRGGGVRLVVVGKLRCAPGRNGGGIMGRLAFGDEDVGVGQGEFDHQTGRCLLLLNRLSGGGPELLGTEG